MFFVKLFEMHGLSPSQVTHIIISSVVPPLDSTLRQVCETYFHLEPLFVEPGIKTGMPVLVDNPTELGADRLADCIAAIERYGGPCIVVDFGTATKFEVISEKGEYLGGAIAPGPGPQRRGAVFACGAPEPRGYQAAGKSDRHQHRRPSAERRCTTATSAWWTAFSSASLRNWDRSRA